jgi:hypothetical protein
MSKRSAKGKKKIPSFFSEDEERRFWAGHDAADYFDWDKAAAEKGQLLDLYFKYFQAR